VDEVDCRIDQVKSDYATLLLYPNARTIMDILDESVGASNWQRAHAEHKGNLFCSIGINFESGWVWKGTQERKATPPPKKVTPPTVLKEPP
jgi:hypothetical protein